MREIKVRAWVDESMEYYLDMIDWTTSRAYWDDKTILMQYTELKDKNGKEIYEGDIIGNKDKYGNVKTKCVIEWEGGHKGYTFFAPINEFEVIGNIYENPELLEEI